MALIFATTSVIATLSCFNRLFQSKDRSVIKEKNIGILPTVGVIENISIYMYVVGTLLNQGKNSFKIVIPSVISSKRQR
jgi:hypothetical protein